MQRVDSDETPLSSVMRSGESGSYVTNENSQNVSHMQSSVSSSAPLSAFSIGRKKKRTLVVMMRQHFPLHEIRILLLLASLFSSGFNDTFRSWQQLPAQLFISWKVAGKWKKSAFSWIFLVSRCSNGIGSCDASLIRAPSVWKRCRVNSKRRSSHLILLKLVKLVSREKQIQTFVSLALLSNNPLRQRKDAIRPLFNELPFLFLPRTRFCLNKRNLY